jgi:hypothetical protein
VAPEWLIWTKSKSPSDHKFTTYLVSIGNAEDPVVLKELDGAFLGVPRGQAAQLYVFDLYEINTRQDDCECEEQARERDEDSDCTVPAMRRLGSLRGLPSGPVVDLPDSDSIDSTTRFGTTAIDGSIGPYIFLSTCIGRRGCGMPHFEEHCDQIIYDWVRLH